MDLAVKRFSDLTLDELYGILKLRVDVFVVEQHCPYEEIDGLDKMAWHVFLKDENDIQAYLRIVDPGFLADDPVIGRVVVRRRRCGSGTQILAAGIRVVREQTEAKRIVLEAQTYARSLYEKAGFRQTSEEFLLDGIPHIGMELEL